MDINKAVQILQLNEFKNARELQKKFYQLAHEYHPDKNQSVDANQRFRFIVEAYEYCLENLDVLARFFGQNQVAQNDILIKSPVDSIKNIEDIFEDIFGFSKTGRVLGFETPCVVYFTVKEFCLGAKKIQKIPAYINCEDCHGLGAAKGTPASICRYCFGQGVIHKVVSSAKQDKIKIMCPQCEGRGRQIKIVCQTCLGSGRLKKLHKQKFVVPQGLKPGESVSLQSYDLILQKQSQIFIEPRVLRDRIFQIENHNLLCEYHAESKRQNTAHIIYLKTPFGLEKATIPSSVQNNDVIRVLNAGLYKDPLGRERGDLIMKILFKKTSFLKKLFGGSA